MEVETNRNKLSYENQKVDQGTIQGTSAVHSLPTPNKTKTSAFPTTFFLPQSLYKIEKWKYKVVSMVHNKNHLASPTNHR